MSSPNDGVMKYFPVQGTTKFETVSFPMTKAFKVDFGAATVATHTTLRLPKGSIIHGFIVRITEAGTSGGSATVQFGFTGTDALTAATAVASLTLDAVIAYSGENVALTADDTFDIIVGTAAMTAGKADIYVCYTPTPSNDLNSSEFREFTV